MFVRAAEIRRKATAIVRRFSPAGNINSAMNLTCSSGFYRLINALSSPFLASTSLEL